jgi:hypothetical protein
MSVHGEERFEGGLVWWLFLDGSGHGIEYRSAALLLLSLRASKLTRGRYVGSFD